METSRRLAAEAWSTGRLSLAEAVESEGDNTIIVEVVAKGFIR